MSASAPLDLLVVGAGLTGLSTAWRARRAGRSVLLLEAAPRVGGVVRTDRVGAYRVERAAGSFPSTAAALLELHAGLARAPALHKPGAGANAQYLATRHGLVALPRTPPALFASPLLTAGQKLRLFAELTRGPRRSGPPESLYAFVRRRFGTGVAESFLKPFTLGVYGTAPEDLGAADAFPMLTTAERASGGVFRHLGKGKPGAEKRSLRSRLARRKPGPGRLKREIWTFEGGMEGFPRAIAEDLGDLVRLSTSVAALRRDGDAVVARTASGEEMRALEVVLSTPAPEQARLVAGFSATAAGLLAAVAYAPMVVTSVGLPPASASLVPRAFGFLRSPGAPLRILGASFPSNLDPAVAPEGHALANVFVGGGRDPGAVALSDDEVRAIVVGDLSAALGGPIVPDLVTIHRWARAIPVLAIGHRARMAEAQRLLAPFGVRLSGSHLTGVGVHACCAPLP